MSISRSRRLRVRHRLLAWAAEYLRDFPWRQSVTSPYGVLIAELLLKRTTATAAARAYGPFLERYPTPRHLALSSQGELAHTLGPLGLSSQRAVAVKKLAQALTERQGLIPSTLATLRALPGLGDYSARAIMSFGHDIPVAVVDGNVERVIRRVFQHSISAGTSRPTFQAIADTLLPRKHHRNFNFAMLDLGSLVCRPSRPLCHICPLQRVCDYAKSPAANTDATALRTVRKAKGMSLAKLAALADTSKLTIINIEARRTTPRAETVKKLADALGVSASELTAN